MIYLDNNTYITQDIEFIDLFMSIDKYQAIQHPKCITDKC